MESPRLTPEELIELIIQQVRLFTGSHSFDDDVSLVVLEIRGVKENRAMSALS